ncbi:MAG: tetratricopeptide repeat protein [Bacteroidota bacterium]
MKTFIMWFRRLIIPVILLAALYFVLTRDSGRVQKISEQSQKSDKEFPADHPAVPGKGNVAQEYSQQLDALKKSVEKDPKNVSHLTMLASMLMDGHNSKEAIQYYERARKLDPKNTAILLDLTVCYSQTGNLSEALNITNVVLNADPKNATALYNRGAIYGQQGKLKEAEQTWKKLIQVAPQSTEAKKAAESLKQLEKM